MNNKREHIAQIEARYGMSVRVEADPFLISPDFAIEKFKTATRVVPEPSHVPLGVNADLMASIDEEEDLDVAEPQHEPVTEVAEVPEAAAEPRAERPADPDADGEGSFAPPPSSSSSEIRRSPRGRRSACR